MNVKAQRSETTRAALVSAARKLFAKHGMENFGYWTMSDGFDVKGALAVEQSAADADERWFKVRTALEERIRQFVTDIRKGMFPVFSRDEKCTSCCDYSTICRIAQIRSLGKTWPPESETAK